MSAQYWGINMYGIWEDALKFKKGIDVDDYWNDEVEAYVKLPNGREILIERQYALDDGWVCGYSPLYPWELKPETTPASAEEVAEALWFHYGPVVDMTRDEFGKAITGISTANYSA